MENESESFHNEYKSTKDLEDQTQILHNDSIDKVESTKALIEILEDYMQRSKNEFDYIFKSAKTHEELSQLWNKEMNRLEEENNDDINIINDIN